MNNSYAAIEGAEQMNQKSDLEAKQAYAEYLRNNENYEEVMVTKSPADIIAKKDGKTFYFEIKYTSKEEKEYFGAATLTEWKAAVDQGNQGRFYFVVAFRKDGNWKFNKYTPEEFMAFSYIPPFKIFFIVPLVGEEDGPAVTEPQEKNQSGQIQNGQGKEKDGSAVTKPRRVRRVQLTLDRLKQMIKLYNDFENPGSNRPCDLPSVYDMTVTKIRQLPEWLVQKVSDFVDSLLNSENRES